MFQTNSTVHVGGMAKGVWLLQRTKNRITRKMFVKVYQGLSRINVKNLKNCAISWAIWKNVVVMTFSILKPMCRTRVKKQKDLDPQHIKFGYIQINSQTLDINNELRVEKFWPSKFLAWHFFVQYSWDLNVNPPLVRILGLNISS